MAAAAPFPLIRVVAVWLMLITVESIHGVMRRLVVEPRLGDLPARQLSVLTGSILIILVFRFMLKWLGPHSTQRWWEMGCLWLTLTLSFEIGLGRAAGMSWGRIASDFDPSRGGFLGFGMLVLLVAPRVLAQRLALVQDSHRKSSPVHAAYE